MRSLARSWMLACGLIVAASLSGSAANAKPKEINLDDEEGEAEAGKKDPKKAAADEGPVTAGQMTEDAAQAKRLFDAERWSEAALLLKKVVDGETGDDEGNKQIAQYHLAICLYRLQFYQASYDLFQKVAAKPNHLKFRETLLWLAKLATQLPEPANIIQHVGNYSAEEIERFNNPQQKELYWQLNYMLGRFKYGKREFEEAIQLFEKVDRDSPYFVKAQFFMGISYVQIRKSVPAVNAFQRIIKAVDEGVKGVEDEARMRDLANLSMARTFYSACITLDANETPRIDEKKLSAAVNYWNRVDVGSEYWLDTLFEQSWAYFMAGDYPHALGNIHTIQSPYFPNQFYPEADIVKAVIYFTLCQYDDATTIVARFQARYEPITKELEGILSKYKGEGSDEAFYKFLVEVQEGNAKLSDQVRPIVETALSDRELLRNIEYVKELEAEMKRFEKSPKSFQDSPVGGDVVDNVELAKSVAIRQAGKLARLRFKRNVDELREHMRNGQKIIVDITNAQRKKLDEEIVSGQFTKEEALEYGVVKPDEEHVLWPFDGEYWRDELGFYRQVVTSKCGG